MSTSGVMEERMESVTAKSTSACRKCRRTAQPARFQRGGVLGKGGGGDQRRLRGFAAQRQPEDQVCRAVAAEDRFCRDRPRAGPALPAVPGTGGRGSGRREAGQQQWRSPRPAAGPAGSRWPKNPAASRAVLCPISGPVAASVSSWLVSSHDHAPAEQIATPQASSASTRFRHTSSGWRGGCPLAQWAAGRRRW